ncbi:MAG: ferritin-like domain-containing protein [Bdellovibrionota bacterium]
MWAIAARLKKRIVDVLLSIYLFNEQRGFRHLEELALIFQEKYPDQIVMLNSIRKHARDEREHYQLFCDYFRKQGYMPYAVNDWCGYCDQIIKLNFGVNMDELDARSMLSNDERFFRLCRLIMITEMRGMSQVDLLLQSWLIRGNDHLSTIFSRIRRDEPSHCFPYQSWLRRHGKVEITYREYFSDIYVNYSLMLWKIPSLVLNPFLKRRSEFPLAFNDSAVERLAL